MNKRKTGALYEKKAEEYLTGKGFKLIARNYRCMYGEIDLIMRDCSTIVLIEVKYRSSVRYGSPGDAVTGSKQRTICKCALCYIKAHGISPDTSFRFDVVGISRENGIVHYEDAFDHIE